MLSRYGYYTSFVRLIAKSDGSGRVVPWQHDWANRLLLLCLGQTKGVTMSTVRCRIAPSPSGFLHIGTAKMALFNWLFARKEGGTFVLRLEDTDAERTEEEFVEAMCEGFKWLGITWDEGPAFGDEPEKGKYAPYRQSQRKKMHQDEGY